MSSCIRWCRATTRLHCVPTSRWVEPIRRFNLLVGREIQKAYGMAPQVVMTLPLLEGTDGVQKMSKSLGNYVGVTEPPDEIFGKIMSISDTLMLRWYDVLEA